MNKRLAKDNTLLSDNLASVKKELRLVQQDRQETVKEVQYLKNSLKRARSSLTEQQPPLPPALEVRNDNDRLTKENSNLRGALDVLRQQIAVLQKSTEKHAAVQQKLADSESTVSVLNGEISQLQQCTSTLAETEVLRTTNDTLAAQTSDLNTRMNAEITRNAALAKEVEELKSTIEFLQMEHSFSETEMVSYFTRIKLLANIEGFYGAIER
eukprot:sb/3470146/